MKCPKCNKVYERLMRHVSYAHPDLYDEESEKAVKMFAAGKTMREIGNSPASLWSFGRGLAKVINESYTEAELKKIKGSRIGSSLKSGYSKNKYTKNNRGRPVKKTKPNLMNRKKPWDMEKYPPNFPKTKNITTSLDCGLNEILVWKGHKLTWRYLKTVDEDQRDEIAKDCHNFFLEYDFLKPRYDMVECNKEFESLKRYKTSVVNENGVKYISNTGTTGSKIYRGFFPNIIKIKGQGKRKSIHECLTDREMLWKVIRNRNGNELIYHPTKKPRQWVMNQSASSMVIGAKNGGFASMGSIFKPTVAKAVYNQWVEDGGNVLDYSAGFGTRLVGCMAADKDLKYCAYEPNTETYDHLQNLIKEFGWEAKTQIKKCGSEEELFDEKFDLAFSSPPYFSYEVYCNEKTQCYNKFPKYDDWLEGYWRQTVKNIKKMLKPDGVFSLNIGGNSNKTMQKISNDLNEIVKEEGYKLVDTWWMKTSRSHLTSKKSQKNKVSESSRLFKLEGIYFYKLEDDK